MLMLKLGNECQVKSIYPDLYSFNGIKNVTHAN